MEGDKGGRGLRPGLNPIIHLIGLERERKNVRYNSIGVRQLRRDRDEASHHAIAWGCLPRLRAESKKRAQTSSVGKKRLVEQRVVLDPPR
jgi:hypothetical protein